ncbi:hydroxylysine kinase-like [Plectropomus leopardus]|uniref:hydroxylysine kinase-like n=1 Tax=Plectropomus leopardus TaxID=160734 RepID=UPI001C4B62D8|nr:hydroxylysine kinase-like [Plectropomus leopardus]
MKALTMVTSVTSMCLMQPEGDGHKISGILDFGKMSCSYYIYELAITIMYMMTEHPKPIEVGGPVLAGWESVLPLNEAEKDCLYVLVLSRFCQSLVFARYNVTLHPENKEYLMTTSRKGVHTLRQLWELGKKQVEKVWFQSAAQFGDEERNMLLYTPPMHNRLIPVNLLSKLIGILSPPIKNKRLCLHSKQTTFYS